jgi:hypothetical protein
VRQRLLFEPRCGVENRAGAEKFLLRACAAIDREVSFGLGPGFRRELRGRLVLEELPFAASRLNSNKADNADIDVYACC